MQCVGGICASPDVGGDGVLCATGQNTSSTPDTTVDGGLVLELNLQTSVAGLVYVEVQDGETGATLNGRALADARGIRGCAAPVCHTLPQS